MKNIILTVLALAGLATGRVWAANQGDAVLKQADTLSFGKYVFGGGAGVTSVTNTTGTAAINLYYTGTSTESLVTITATAMTFYTPAGTVDANVGTAGVITYATTLGANNVGSLCDYLNGKTSSITTYRCVPLGAKRNDRIAGTLSLQTAASGTNNLGAVGGFNVPFTTNSVISLGIIPSPDRRVILKWCQFNAQNTGGDSVYIYGAPKKYTATTPKTLWPLTAQNLWSQGVTSPKDPFNVTLDDTYQVWTGTATNNTSVQYPQTVGIAPWLEFAQDAHVVIRAGGIDIGNNAVNTNANFINCTWDER